MGLVGGEKWGVMVGRRRNMGLKGGRGKGLVGQGMGVGWKMVVWGEMG